jgi:hypothetical protein
MEREIRVEEFCGIIADEEISLPVIVDTNGMSWFKGTQIAEIIGSI